MSTPTPVPGGSFGDTPTPAPAPDDLAARLARLRARVAAREPDYLGAVLVSVDCLAELFRQRDALVALLRAQMERAHAGRKEPPDA